MKIIRSCILAVIVFSNCIFASAQSKSDSLKQTNYEIGLHIPVIESINGFPRGYFQYASFKIEKNKNALRTGIGVGLPIYFGERKRYSYIASIGYERRIFNRKSQLLLGADINYYYTYGRYLNYWESTNRYSIGPVIAYLYKPTAHLAFQVQLPWSVGPLKQTYSDRFVEKHLSLLYRPDILTAYYRF